MLSEHKPQIPQTWSAAFVIESGMAIQGRIANVVLKGKILFVSQADPGYDWIFVHGIVGLITQYGGANSHMAIRSAELGIPAAIGVGDRLFESLAHCRRIRLDCNAKKIEVVAN